MRKFFAVISLILLLCLLGACTPLNYTAAEVTETAEVTEETTEKVAEEAVIVKPGVTRKDPVETEPETEPETESETETYYEPEPVQVNEPVYDGEVYYEYDLPFRRGYSEFVGPWAYMFYAKDEETEFICHDAYDGYVPKAGDLLITGEDFDEFYISDSALNGITGLGRFYFWHADWAWNGHILYIAANNDGILTCYEGNTIAPGQDLDIYDPDYKHKSSIDSVEIDFYTSETLTADKPAEKPIRVVVETCYPEDFVLALNSTAEEILQEFTDNPEGTRRAVLNFYLKDIDWCGLFVHYLIHRTASYY